MLEDKITFLHPTKYKSKYEFFHLFLALISVKK